MVKIRLIWHSMSKSPLINGFLKYERPDERDDTTL